MHQHVCCVYIYMCVIHADPSRQLKILLLLLLLLLLAAMLHSILQITSSTALSLARCGVY